MAIAGPTFGRSTADPQAYDVLEEKVPSAEDRHGEAKVAEPADEPFEVREGRGDQVGLPARN